MWVLPIGACVTAVSMTVLGFAAVPYRLNLALVLVLAGEIAFFHQTRAV